MSRITGYNRNNVEMPPLRLCKFLLQLTYAKYIDYLLVQTDFLSIKQSSFCSFLVHLEVQLDP